MGCASSTPATLVVQPRGVEPHILPSEIPTSDGVATVEIYDEFCSSGAMQKRHDELRKAVGADDPKPPWDWSYHEEYKATDSIFTCKAGGALLFKEQRDEWAFTPKFSTVKYCDSSGTLIALLSEGARDDSGAMKAMNYQQRKGKALLYTPVGGSSPAGGDLGHGTKTVEGVAMRVVGETRCFFDSCAFHPAVAGGKYGPATLKMSVVGRVKGVIKNGMGECVATVEKMNELISYYNPNPIAVSVAANVDVVLVIALVLQWSANERSLRASAAPFIADRDPRVPRGGGP